MKLLVLGGDGYCGWPTALYFSERGYEVAILDSSIRRKWDDDLGIQSLIPISDLGVRLKVWAEHTGRRIRWYQGCLTDYPFLASTLEQFRPDAVIHFAEQRSAPFSMLDREHAVLTQSNNVLGTLNLLFGLRDIVPHCHLVKLGTMGEYGQPNIAIEEGFIEVVHEGRRDRLPYPMQPGSFYHLSKVHDSQNIMFACRIWGLRATDLHQGVVYGNDTEETSKDERLTNRFDYDSIFGTVLNRFCVQAAVGHPLTVYGRGRQIRAFIALGDILRCIELAVSNPAAPGEYRVLNQFTEQFALLDLAHLVQKAAAPLGIRAEITSIANPRIEKEEHFYQAKATKLRELGLRPELLSQDFLTSVLKRVLLYKDRVRLASVLPKISWAPPSRPPAAPK